MYEAFQKELITILTEIRDLLKPKEKTLRKHDPTLAEGELLPQLAKLWNDYTDAEFPKVESMSKSSSRYKSAIKRWKERPDGKYWSGIIMRINRSRFCKGDNTRKWKADFEFFVRPDSAAKISEGKYDDREQIKEKPKAIPFEIDPITGEVILK